MYPPRVSYFQTQKDTLLIIINKQFKTHNMKKKKKEKKKKRKGVCKPLLRCSFLLPSEALEVTSFYE